MTKAELEARLKKEKYRLAVVEENLLLVTHQMGRATKARDLQLQAIDDIEAEIMLYNTGKVE